MVRRVWLAALVAAVGAQMAGAQTVPVDPKALDLYFVIDQSGSIADRNSDCKKLDGSPTCMQLLARFANQTAHRMAELVGSYYDPPDVQGIRLGIVMFRCNGVSKKPKVLLAPTGDYQVLAEGFRELSRERANGYTCAQSALTEVNQWIEDQPEPQRKTAVLYLTDGLLEKRDRPKSQEQADKIIADPYSQTFGVSIGGGSKQTNQIADITGDKSLIWDAQDATALSDIIDELALFIFGDFRAVLEEGLAPADVCQGATPKMQVTGSSVSALSQLSCVFALEGLPGQTVTTPGSKVDGVWECMFPESFYTDADGERVQVNMTDPGSSRKLGQPTTFVLGRKPCVTLTPDLPDGRCIGDSLTFSLAGPTLTAFVDDSDLSYTYKCQFSITENGYSYTVDSLGVASRDEETDEPQIACTMPDEAAIRFAAADAAAAEPLAARDAAAGPDASAIDLLVMPPPRLAGVSIVVELTSPEPSTIPGTTTRTLVAEAQELPQIELLLGSAECMAADVSTSACWRTRGQAKAAFSGRVVDYVMEQSAGAAELKPVCLIGTAENDTEPAFIVDAVPVLGGDGGLECDMPVDFVEPLPDGAVSRDVQADLFLMHEGSGKLLRLSNLFDESRLFTMNSCLVVQQDTESCFGEPLTVLVQSNEGVPLLESEGVTCHFVGFDEALQLQGALLPAPESGPNAYSCSTDGKLDGLLGISFSHVEVRSHGIVVKAQAIGTEESKCIAVSTRNTPADRFEPATGTVQDGRFDLDKCWGGDPGAPAEVLFLGKTARAIIDNEASCVFYGGGEVTRIPAEAATGLRASTSPFQTTRGLTCVVPTEIFEGLGGELTGASGENMLTVALELTGSTFNGDPMTQVIVRQELSLRSQTGAPCFVSDVVPTERPGQTTPPLCLGTPAELRITGPSLAMLVPLLGADPACTFDRGDPAIGEVASDGAMLTCEMPPLSSVDTKKVRSVVIADIARLPVQEYSINAEDACFRPVVQVSPQGAGRRRRVLQAGGDNGDGDGAAAGDFCLGDGMATAFAGESIDFVVDAIGMDNLTCVWLPNVDDFDFVTDPTPDVVAPVLESDGSVRCDSATWEPFDPSGVQNGAYAELHLTMLLTADHQVSGIGAMVGRAVDFRSGDFAPAVCTDVSGWGDDLDAADQDCARESVELQLGGRTAFALAAGFNVSEPQSCWGDPEFEDMRVMCAFTEVGGGTVMAEPDFAPGSITCVAGGWDPYEGGGNYEAVQMQVCMDGGVMATVKSQSFLPTAGRRCLEVSGPSASCLGEVADLSLTGVTLSSYKAAAAANGTGLADAATCTPRDAETSELAPGSTDESLLCRVSESFLPDKELRAKDYSVTFHFGDEKLEFRPEATVRVPLHDASEERCMLTESANAICSGGGSGSGETVVVMRGISASEAPLDEVQCVFKNTTTASQQIVAPTRIDGSERLVCASESGAFDTFYVYWASDLELHSGDVVLDENTCVGARRTVGDGPDDPDDPGVTAPPTPLGAGGPNSSLGATLAIVFACLLLVLLVLFFVIRKRNRREEEGEPGVVPETAKTIPDTGVEDDIELGAGAGMLGGFAVGDRVEAYGAFDPKNYGDAQGWFRGSVVQDNQDGTFTVDLDVLQADAEGSKVVVAAGDLRLPATDFRVGEQVEARRGAGNDWHAATVLRVNPDCTYNLSYETDGLGDEEGVHGDLLRTRKMLFRVGDLVEARHVTTKGVFERAEVRALNMNAETYTVAFSGRAADNGPEGGKKAGPELPQEEVVVEVPAADVRAFMLVVGEVVDVRLEDEVVRATITAVDTAGRTCDVEYDAAAAAPPAGKQDRPGTVPWPAIFRPRFVVGEAVEVMPLAASQSAFASGEETDAESDDETNASLGATAKQAWLPARIKAVDAATNKYTVAYDDKKRGEETEVPVKRIRAPGAGGGAGAADGAAADGAADGAGRFAVGEFVQVQVELSEESGKPVRWYKARVEAVNDDGTYDVEFSKGPQAGTTERNVPAVRLRELGSEDGLEVDTAAAAASEDDVALEAEPSSPLPDVFRPPPRDHPQASADDGLAVPFHLRFRKRKPLGFMELPNNQFEVTLDMTNGLGLSLGWTNDNRVIVAGFRDLPNGDWGPVEACGLVGLKDQLIKVNGTSIGGKSFVEVSELIKNSGKTIRLHFGRWTDEDAVVHGAGV